MTAFDFLRGLALAWLALMAFAVLLEILDAYDELAFRLAELEKSDAAD